jgi:hypothetical protein
MTSRALFLSAAIGLAAGVATSSQGAITLGNGEVASLQSILASTDHQVNIGDKTFTFASFTSSAFIASNVFISGFIAPNPLNGIGFDITGGFGDVNPTDGAFSEFNILYNVEVQPAFLQQGYRLKDVGLVFNGAATGAGSFSRVDESVFDFFGQPGVNLLTTLTASAIGGGPSSLQDFRDFSPANYTKFQVNKDVKFFANGLGGTASASFVRQSFSQVIVPAPGAAALVGFGGLISIRRRRA